MRTTDERLDRRTECPLGRANRESATNRQHSGSPKPTRSPSGGPLASACYVAASDIAIEPRCWRGDAGMNKRRDGGRAGAQGRVAGTHRLASSRGVGSDPAPQASDTDQRSGSLTPHLKLTPREVAYGFAYGKCDQLGPLPRVAARWRPLAAMESAILPALRRPPCLVSFSGGRDSSIVLAVAASAARRQGLSLPIPVTRAFPRRAEGGGIGMAGTRGRAPRATGVGARRRRERVRFRRSRRRAEPPTAWAAVAPELLFFTHRCLNARAVGRC